MVRLLILVAVVGLLIWLLHWFRTTPAPQVANALRKGALWGGIAVLLLLTLTGRLNPIFAAVAAMIPVLLRVANLVRMLPMLRQLLQSLGLGGLPGTATGSGPAGSAAGGGQGSAIRTRYLDMRLDHATGAMDGSVREGPFSGRLLSELTVAQLLRMLELYQDSDAQSASVLTAYLEREHPDWRDEAARTGTHTGTDGTGSAKAGSGLTREEALAVLGLAPGADDEAVRTAHRRLMQKLHPDRGGSDYLAAQINAAKRLLLGD